MIVQIILKAENLQYFRSHLNKHIIIVHVLIECRESEEYLFKYLN
jgi:hypothetical protein